MLFSRAHFFVLISGCLFFGLFSVFSGKELCWDLVSYHYYNPYALLHGRWGKDIWPGVYTQVFYNPTLDFLTYFLIQFFSPLMAEFIMGAIHGINFWLVFLISYFFIPNKNKLFLSLILAAFGLFGAMASSEIGSFMGDDTISLLILSAVLLQLFVLRDVEVLPFKKLIGIGFLLGLASGLKLTATFFLLSYVGALLLFPDRTFSFKKRIQWILLVGSAAIIGFLLASGYWMVFLYLKFQSPFFPFYNKLFQSPFFPLVNWHDLRFFPQTIWQSLFYPFYFSWNYQTADLPFLDLRFPIVYVCLILFGMSYFFQKKMQVSRSDSWFFCFFILSYLAWQWSFSISRYLIALEMLCPLMIYQAVRLTFNDTHKVNLIIAMLFATLFVTTYPMGQERSFEYRGSYFNIQLPPLNPSENAIVLIRAPVFYNADVNDKNHLGDSARFAAAILQTYLIPSFPETWRFIGIPAVSDRYTFSDEIKQIIQQHTGSIYVLSSQDNMQSFYRAIKKIDLIPTRYCSRIQSDYLRLPHRRHEIVLLCKVTK